jgi:hypothetical protein
LDVGYASLTTTKSGKFSKFGAKLIRILTIEIRG